MKKLSIMFAALAIVFAVSSAFTTKSGGNVDRWFQYQQADDLSAFSQPGSFDDHTNYDFTNPEISPSNCSTGDIVCSVKFSVDELDTELSDAEISSTVTAVGGATNLDIEYKQ